MTAADDADEDLGPCARCGGEQFRLEGQGYGWGQGILGFLCCGPFGLLFGAAGSRTVQEVCERCGAIRRTFTQVRRTAWHCHRIPERCLVWRGRPLPLCARCTGLAAGALAAATALACLMAFLRVGLAPAWTVPMAVAGLAVPALDWARQTFLDRPSTNRRRFGTGLFGGASLMVLVVALAGMA